jgi:TonB family protein
VDAPETQLPGTLLPAPASGWAATYDGVREALTARKKGWQTVMLADVTTPKPLQSDANAAFFIPELSHAIEVRQSGAEADVTMPNGKHATIPVAPGATSVFGASDEQFYVALTFQRPADAHDDVVVILHGEKPLNLVSRVEPKYPVIETWRNHTGTIMSQLRIDPDGSVGSVQVLQKVQPLIDEATVAAMKQWRFEPPTHDGRPVTAYMIMSTIYRVE